MPDERALSDWLGSPWLAALFLAVLVMLAVLELRWPAAPLTPQPRNRIATNVALSVLSLAAQIAAGGLLLSLVAWADRSGIGLLPLLGVSGWARVALGVVLLSLVSYWIHRWSHGVPWLWRLHRVHHADTHLDLSSALRHHPAEAMVVALATAAGATLGGTGPTAIMLYGTLVLLLAFIQHADLALPARGFGWLPWLIVTPAVHRQHHSPVRRLTDSNYGEVLTVWDRIFATWSGARAPGEGQIGLGDDSDSTAHMLRHQLWGRL